MAQHSGGGVDMGSVVKWAALIGGGYFLYTRFGALGSLFSSTAAAAPAATPAAAPASPAAPPAAPPAPPAAPPAPPPPHLDLTIALVNAAKNDPAYKSSPWVLSDPTAKPTMNADQWNYYRNSLFPPALTGDQFVKAFPYVVSGDRTMQLTVDQFVQAIKGAGLGALGFGALPARAHRVTLPNGKPGLVWVRTNWGPRRA